MLIAPLHDQSILRDIRKVVVWHFGMPAQKYVEMDAEAYRDRVARAQDELNSLGMAWRLAKDFMPSIRQMLGHGEILVQSNLYLRAVRPSQKGQESVGWHRE